MPVEDPDEATPHLALLSRDHHHALIMSQALRHGAPDRLRAAYPTEPNALIATLRQRFQQELAPHFQIEELELLPRCRDQPGPLGAQAARIEREHHQLRTMLADLAPGPTLADRLDAFALLLDAHVRFEEQSWFPSLENALGAAVLDRLASPLTPDQSDEEVGQLRERAKELICLYRVNDALLDRSHVPPTVFRGVLEAIPSGWQRPATTAARIEYLGRHYLGPGFSDRGARLRAAIRTWERAVGSIAVVDRALDESETDGFLREEQDLLDSIAVRLGDYLEWKQQELIGEPIGAAAAQWKWRQAFAERLALALDPERFGVRAVYLTGSTQRGEAAPASDIDLAILFRGTPQQRQDLSLWLEGWSLCLAEVAYRQAGIVSSSGLLDVTWLKRDPTAVESVRFRALPLGAKPSID